MDEDLVKRVKGYKANLGPHLDSPALAMIVLSFNHEGNIAKIFERLHPVADELIVCEDGSLDSSLETWRKLLTGRNDFLLRSNDLHEIRAFNRAISYSRASFVCLMQDDDIPPESDEWVCHAMSLFDADPRLAVLGGFHGILLDAEGKETGVYGCRDGKWSDRGVKDIPTMTATGIPFMHVAGVTTSPTFIRRRAFIELLGFDLDFGAAGESAPFFVPELCLRAWMNDWHIGLYGLPPMAFERQIGGKGTGAFCNESIRNNNERVSKLLDLRYEGRNYDYILRKITALNSTLKRG